MWLPRGWHICKVVLGVRKPDKRRAPARAAYRLCPVSTSSQSCFDEVGCFDLIERAIANGVVITVYLDDFIGSHDDMATLTHAYNDIRETCVAAGKSN